MAARTITVTLPNGETAKRKTERNYSHAVCLYSSVLSFCGSYELAQKRINTCHPKVRQGLTIVQVNA